MMMAAFLLCIYVCSSPRKAAKSLEVFNFMFHGLLGDSPCQATIRTWLAKMGLDAIKHKDRTLDEAYAIIMDASISVGASRCFWHPKYLQTTQGRHSPMPMRRLLALQSQGTGLLPR